jgi:isopentenyl phosphate kinase
MIMRHFIKLGGSLITDKNTPLTPRPLVIQRLAREIAAAYRSDPDRRWIISHGSGSYGHVAGQRYNTRQGVHDARGWQGFAETGYIAGQLNRLVLAALLRAGLPVISLPPSALTRCRDGRIIHFHVEPVIAALDRGLIPLLFGDVAFDETRGGTIVSTEEVLAALARHLPPHRLTLAGVVDGVYDDDPLRNPDARAIPFIRVGELDMLNAALSGSHGVDVTGGMAGKIREMAALIQQHPDLRVHLISGETPGRLQRHLQDPDLPLGTTLSI